MSYTRPSPRPGELYNSYGPPRPSAGNAYPFARSQASEARPSRPSLHHYPTAGPSWRGASSRPAPRSYDDAGFGPPSPQPPRRPPYNNLSSRSSDRTVFDPPRYPSRPSAMTEDRSRNFQARSHDARDHRSTHASNRGLPMRGEHPRSATFHDHDHQNYLDSEELGPVPENNHDSEAAQGSWSWDKIKKTMWGNTAADARDNNQPSQEDRVPDDYPQETQNTLWTKLTTVGANIQKKIHGDDGYASDASDYEGESHLIRIMKKYYTENAESAYDLPDWLFTPAELEEAHSSTKETSLVDSHRPGRRPGRYDEYEYSEEEDYRRGEAAGSGRGRLTDIYDSVDQDRNHHSRNGSSAKHSFDSGYGSTSSNTAGRRGRYDDSRSEFTESNSGKPSSLGRNRLAANREPFARPPTSKFHNNPPRSVINNNMTSRAYSDNRSGVTRGPPTDGYTNEPRRFRNPPASSRPPQPAYSTPTVVDYSRPSGQDDRYPIPKSKYQRSYA